MQSITSREQNKKQGAKYPPDEGGSLLLLLILLLSFALLVALPVLHLAIIEHTASLHAQIDLQAYYLAEAGISQAQRLLRFSALAPLPVGRQQLGNGSYSIERDEGKLVAMGRVASTTTRLGLSYTPKDLTQGYLCCIGNASVDGQLRLAAGTSARIAGNTLILGDLFCEESSWLAVEGELALTGDSGGDGKLAPTQPLQRTNPLEEELWLWLQALREQAGEPLPSPITGRILLQPGHIYEWSGAADWSQLTLVGPSGNEPAATVIVRGNLSWHSGSGNLNLLVEGNCQQVVIGDPRLDLQGLLWVQGELTVQALHLQGILLAESVCLLTGGVTQAENLLVTSYPWQDSADGLVIPVFSDWNYGVVGG